MIKSVNRYINELMLEFGFHNYHDFCSSTFGFAAKKSSLLLSFSLASIGTFIQTFLGLDPIVYIAFIALLFLEFSTGIKASVREGRRLRSRKLGRVILKLLVYTLIIGIVNIFRTRLQVPTALGFKVNVYSFIYFSALNLIIFQLILSVFENLTRLGYKETSKIFKYLSNKIEKWFDIENNADKYDEKDENLFDIDNDEDKHKDKSNSN